MEKILFNFDKLNEEDKLLIQYAVQFDRDCHYNFFKEIIKNNEDSFIIKMKKLYREDYNEYIEDMKKSFILDINYLIKFFNYNLKNDKICNKYDKVFLKFNISKEQFTKENKLKFNFKNSTQEDIKFIYNQIDNLYRFVYNKLIDIISNNDKRNEILKKTNISYEEFIKVFKDLYIKLCNFLYKIFEEACGKNNYDYWIHKEIRHKFKIKKKELLSYQKDIIPKKVI